ncbi:MAG TPA: prolyl oligopeptidase family serine peptidase [Cyclobacteriaceae bacterium]|nr:prolyl oligopeptidase family serine peptidase [Cyclobacteriaceae bacterium]
MTRKSISFTILMFSFLTSSFAQDLSLFEKKMYISGTDTLRYRLLLPENFDKSKKYPLVLFLHGAGERGNDNEKQLVLGMPRFVEPGNRKNLPCIVIAPQCPLIQSWHSAKTNRDVSPPVREFDYTKPIPKPLQLAIDLTNSIINEGSVDKSKVVIAGLSMGGMGTFEAVGRFPKLFVAAAPICGGGDTKFYSSTQAKVDFWIFHGDADATVDVKYSLAMYARLQELKANVKYTGYPGVGHNSWDNAFAEADFLPWLLGKH